MKKLLTPLELKVMNLLWEKQSAYVKDLLDEWPDAQVPAYNTVSTTVRILEEKGFVGHEAFGRTHRYHPLVEKCVYQQQLLQNVIDNAFSGSLSSLVSTLVDNGELEESELEALKQLIEKHEHDSRHSH
jgi:predicted transcriptional regulator